MGWRPWITDLAKLTNLEKLGINGLDEETLRLLTIEFGGGGLDKLRSLLTIAVGGFSSDLLEALSGKHRLLTLNGKLPLFPVAIKPQ
ncbi:hypothetical protein FRX31_011677 [Thalictrum thalictroides]|uniref:Uncharacterized protein n=1 Tax=Thalictrum thalictroides TaxID=46969 RepID=A0A7J6WMY7_THATH|nr:hypothetical protein FRX31_011677 [Thalictrum thalictroides]